MPVHAPDEGRIFDRTLATSTGRERWSWTAIREGFPRSGPKAANLVLPIAKRQLGARRITSNHFARVRVQETKVNRSTMRPSDPLRGRASIHRESGAIDAFVLAFAGHRQLERQSVAVDQAHVDPVPVDCAEGCLELGIDGRSASEVVVAALPRTAAVPDAAIGTLVIAAHLGPKPGAGQPGRRSKMKGLAGVQPDVLPIDALHVSDPEGLPVASVLDHQPLRTYIRKRQE